MSASFAIVVSSLLNLFIGMFSGLYSTSIVGNPENVFTSPSTTNNYIMNGTTGMPLNLNLSSLNIGGCEVKFNEATNCLTMDCPVCIDNLTLADFLDVIEINQTIDELWNDVTCKELPVKFCDDTRFYVNNDGYFEIWAPHGLVINGSVNYLDVENFIEIGIATFLWDGEKMIISSGENGTIYLDPVIIEDRIEFGTNGYVKGPVKIMNSGYIVMDDSVGTIESLNELSLISDNGTTYDSGSGIHQFHGGVCANDGFTCPTRFSDTVEFNEVASFNRPTNFYDDVSMSNDLEVIGCIKTDCLNYTFSDIDVENLHVLISAHLEGTTKLDGTNFIYGNTLFDRGLVQFNNYTNVAGQQMVIGPNMLYLQPNQTYCPSEVFTVENGCLEQCPNYTTCDMTVKSLTSLSSINTNDVYADDIDVENAISAETVIAQKVYVINFTVSPNVTTNVVDFGSVQLDAATLAYLLSLNTTIGNNTTLMMDYVMIGENAGLEKNVMVGDHVTAGDSIFAIHSKDSANIWINAKSDRNGTFDSPFLYATGDGQMYGFIGYINPIGDTYLMTGGHTGNNSRDFGIYTGAEWTINGKYTLPTITSFGTLRLYIDDAADLLQVFSDFKLSCGSEVDKILNESTFVSNDPRALVTQSSVKDYVDNSLLNYVLIGQNPGLEKTVILGDYYTSGPSSLQLHSLDDVILWINGKADQSGSSDNPFLLLTNSGQNYGFQLYINPYGHSHLISGGSAGNNARDLVFSTGATWTKTGNTSLPIMNDIGTTQVYIDHGRNKMTVYCDFELSNGTKVNKILNESDFASNDPEAIATQSSIKNYVDNSVQSLISSGTFSRTFYGPWNTENITSTLRYEKFYKTVTLSIGETIGSCNYYSPIYMEIPLPSEIRPYYYFTEIGPHTINVDTNVVGAIEIFTNGSLIVWGKHTYSEFSVGSGHCGFYNYYVTYFTS